MRDGPGSELPGAQQDRIHSQPTEEASLVTADHSECQEDRGVYYIIWIALDPIL